MNFKLNCIIVLLKLLSLIVMRVFINPPELKSKTSCLKLFWIKFIKILYFKIIKLKIIKMKEAAIMIKTYTIFWIVKELVGMAFAEAVVLAVIIELAEIGMLVFGIG